MNSDKIINFRDINQATKVNNIERSNPFDVSIKNVFNSNKNQNKVSETPTQSFVGTLTPNKIRELDLSKPFFNDRNPLDTEIL